MSGAPPLPELSDVVAAARRLEAVAVRTPVLSFDGLDEVAGARVHLKLESMQRTGSFKFRGAYNAVANLTDAERARPLLASSSGNHAQALALAARLHDAKATILMPSDAPLSKREGTERLGATVIEFDRPTTDREALTAEWVERLGGTLIHAYDNPHTVAGAGTSALELWQDRPNLDGVVVPCSGGGNLAGWSLTWSSLAPGVAVYGVCPEAADGPLRSFRAGEPVGAPYGDTIADGLQAHAPGAVNVAVFASRVTDVVTITDEEILVAMRAVWQHAKLVVEPSGAAALAAVIAGKVPVGALDVGVLVSGGNMDPGRAATLLGG